MNPLARIRSGESGPFMELTASELDAVARVSSDEEGWVALAFNPDGQLAAVFPLHDHLPESDAWDAPELTAAINALIRWAKARPSDTVLVGFAVTFHLTGPLRLDVTDGVGSATTLARLVREIAETYED